MTAVRDGLATLKVLEETDKECFTTGPRRSFCLLPFLLRKNEQPVQLKERMRKVMLAFQENKVPIAGHNRAMWCTISKPRDAREKAGHCRAIRAAVHSFNKECIASMDCDYGTGTCWLGSSVLGSAVSKPPHEDHRLHYVESKSCRPWVDLTALSEGTQSDITELQEFFQNSVRN